MSWYCYGITPEGADPAGLQGLSGRRIERISDGRLAMVVSALEPEVFKGVEAEGLVPDSRLARLAAEHDLAVQHLFERGPILPMRLGGFIRDQSGVITLLRERCVEWLQALGHVAGKAEWICRVELDDATPLPAAQPPALPVGSGTAYIEQKLNRARTVQERQDRLDLLLERLHTDLSKQAVEARSVPSVATTVVFNVAYLVSGEDDFRAAVEANAPLLAEQGCSVGLTGPWPPYHFVEVKVQSEAVHAPA